MKIIFKSLFFLCFSTSFCFAGTGQEFCQDWISSIKTVRCLQEKSRTESNIKNYYGKNKGLKRGSRGAKVMFGLSMESLEEYFKQLPKTAFLEEDKKVIAEYAFQIYCVVLPLIKNLHDEKLRCNPGSPYFEDIDKCAESLSFFVKHFTNLESTMLPFLKVEPGSKGVFFQDYSVYFDKRDWLLGQQRQIHNIFHRLDLMDLDKLDLPTRYKDCLIESISKRRKNLQTILSALSTQIREESCAFKKNYKNLSSKSSSQDFYEEREMGTKQEFINDSQKIAFHPFLIKFESKVRSEEVFLSAEQRAQSTSLLNKMLEEKELLSLRSTSHISQRKSQSKKKIEGKFARPQKETARPTLDSTSSTTSSSERPEPALSAREEEANQDLSLEDQIHPALVVEGGPCETEISASSSSSVASSSCDAGMSEDRLENTSFVNEWLTDIINKSQSKNETFGIFEKATRLKSMFAENNDLLEQVQEAAAGLAARLQMFETHSVSHKVPQRSEPFFTFLMESPISYLKGLRFALVEAFFNTLGIKIDKNRAGSRIHFSFSDERAHHNASIHLHDKQNGELDGGRISSLRKFLIDCGFNYSETQSLPGQKSAHKRRR